MEWRKVLEALRVFLLVTAGVRTFAFGQASFFCRLRLRLRTLRLPTPTLPALGVGFKKTSRKFGVGYIPPRKRFFGPGGGAVGRVRTRRRIWSARSRAITCTYNEHVSLYLQQTPASCNYTNCNYMYRGCVCQGWHSLALVGGLHDSHTISVDTVAYPWYGISTVKREGKRNGSDNATTRRRDRPIIRRCC